MRTTAQLCLALLFFSAHEGATQTMSARALTPVAQVNRVMDGANFSTQTQLSGHLPQWVRTENLSGTRVNPGTTLHLSVVLTRAPQVQAAFEKLLADQQDSTSALYHHWLTPQQVGELYGPTQHDVDAVTAWAATQRLRVDSVSPSRMIVAVSGSVATVGNAFRVSFSNYAYRDSPLIAVDGEPSIPAALTPIIRSIDGLANVPPRPASHGGALGQQANPGGIKPLYDVSNIHLLAPGDFTIIYDIGSVYSGGNTGATIGTKAQHIAVIDRSDVAATDISEWATNVGLTGYQYNTIFSSGVDPGQAGNGDQLEATLDINRTVSVATGAVSDLIVAANANGGIFNAASYNVNTLVDPVMSISFYGCEANASQANVNAWDTLFSTGAAEGISTFVCSGDSGAAGCASDFSAPPAVTPVLSANYICSSSYDTCVGGTEFNDTANPSQYWSSTNGTGKASALSYIPEGAWNEAQQGSAFYIQAGGGGVSKYIAKPSWQTGTGVPADGYRDQPDLAFTSAAHDGYYSCYAVGGGDCSKGYYEYFAGTSAATPDMAGITALLNTRAGSSQGNLNPTLYKLAKSAPAAFHDVTVATSGVSTCSTAVASMCNNSTPSQTALTGGLAGYAVTAGYDQATGLGSLDVANFLAAASPVTTTLTVKASATQATTTQALTFTATLTPASSSVAAPTGSVQFYSNGTAFGSAVTLSSNSATSVAQAFSPAGSYNITATYTGDNYFVGSTAPAVVVTTTIPQPAITLAATAPTISFTSGATTGNTDTVTVTSSNGFAGSVSLSCVITTSQAAFQPSCVVSPSPVTVASGGSATSTVTISSTVAQALVHPAGVDSSVREAFLGGAAALMALMLLPRRRLLWKALVIILFSVAGATFLAGCSSHPGTGATSTPRSSAGSYTVTVTASGTGVSTVTTTFAVTIN